ncbi:hypothetical protein A6R68_01844 [Neotoma lepida]|uniref:glyceraldehyde-3-phosphate dehydrogenase (phosphorylating) n=1 Tax=Neotoma lepida TaxID=56216 RepID=A0A1A6GVF6_NEOLE|nr:hypothetical protein A6R68_01844 [Neotoma lepida]
MMVNDKVCDMTEPQKYDKSIMIVSNASSTTNCIVPLVKVINDNYYITERLVVIVHAITATQKSVDVPSGKLRSDGHRDAQNIVPASIGLSKAMDKVILELNCKLIDMVFPVPTSNVSAMD